jgi:hypothetical protein
VLQQMGSYLRHISESYRTMQKCMVEWINILYVGQSKYLPVVMNGQHNVEIRKNPW